MPNRPQGDIKLAPKGVEGLVVSILKYTVQYYVQGKIAPGFDEVLELCAETKYPATADWFERELKYLFGILPGEKDQPRWKPMEADAIVKAAVLQLTHPKYHELWILGLEHSDFRRYAHLAVYRTPAKPASSL